MADKTIVVERKTVYEVRGVVGGEDVSLMSYDEDAPSEDDQAYMLALHGGRAEHSYVARSTYTTMVEIDIV